jgi:hypothetical protein
MDEWVSLLVVHLTADTPDIDVDGVGCGVEVKIPHVL